MLPPPCLEERKSAIYRSLPADASLPSPCKASPCLTRNRILDKISSSMSLACSFSTLCALLSCSPTSFVVFGSFTTASTASTCDLDWRCFLKHTVASFQFDRVKSAMASKSKTRAYYIANNFTSTHVSVSDHSCVVRIFVGPL